MLALIRESSKSKVISNTADQTGEAEIEMKHDEDDVIQTQLCHRGFRHKDMNHVANEASPCGCGCQPQNAEMNAHARKDFEARLC